MARQADRKKFSAWQQRLRRFTTSGLPVVRFCARERVSVATFWYWRRKCEGTYSKPVTMAATFSPVEVFGGRSVTLRFAAGAVLEIPEDRPELVRVAIEAMAGASPQC